MPSPDQYTVTRYECIGERALLHSVIQQEPQVLVYMNSFLSFLLHGLHEYGYPVLWLIIFMAAVGLPLPASLVLLAAGVFAAHGDFNIALLIGITITASSCGDNVGYFIGRRWGSKTLHWLEQPRRIQLISARTITR